MDLNLNGKAAIVTGGSRGIGKAVAMELAREGVDVLICSRNQEAVEATAKEIEAATGRKIVGVVADTTSNDSVANMVNTAIQAFGKVDILVNNAAAPGGFVQGGLSDADDQDLLKDIDTKVVGYVRCSKAVASHMQSQGWGRIINIGGMAGRNAGTISGMRNMALAHLSKTLSNELGPHGINVNVVHPGATRTERSGPMYQQQAQEQGVSVEEIENRVAQGISVRKIIDASEIAYVVTFLASPKAVGITGESIASGGGLGVSVYL